MAPRGSQRGAREVVGTESSTAGAGILLIGTLTGVDELAFCASAGAVTSHTTARVVSVKNARKSLDLIKRGIVWYVPRAERKQSHWQLGPDLA